VQHAGQQCRAEREGKGKCSGQVVLVLPEQVEHIADLPVVPGQPRPCHDGECHYVRQ
jgi:hypothetical protein